MVYSKEREHLKVKRKRNPWESRPYAWKSSVNQMAPIHILYLYICAYCTLNTKFNTVQL